MLKQINVRTKERIEFVDVTSLVRNAVRDSNASRGLCVVYVPHTTAGVTINENTDPAVKEDIITKFQELVPLEGSYKHSEGNSPAHIMASMVGPSVTIIIESGKPILGTWQSVYFCEFDGPRTRNLLVKVLKE